MVLQQRIPIPVWGWSTPGHTIRVTLAGHGAETVANARGMWMVKLPSLPAEPYVGQALDLVVEGDSTVTIHDVAIGEVWLCSGQSNMEWPLACCAAAEATLAKAELPHLRLFTVAHAGATSPQDDVQPDAGWSASTAESAAGFSALAWHFGQTLHRRLQIPVGLIHSSYKGTPAESWMSRAALDSDHALRPILDRVPATLPTSDAAPYRKQFATWERKARQQDPGNAGVRKKWHQPSFDDDTWTTMDLPQPWQRAGITSDGAVWFRRTVDVPADWKGKALDLSLGPIDHIDVVYVDGERIGGIDPETADPRLVPRRYQVPAALVKKRTLTLAIRVFGRGGVAGFTGSADQMWMRPAPTVAGSKKVKGTTRTTKTTKQLSLAGTWRHRVELALDPLDDVPPQPLHRTHQHVPASLNNAMIQPLVPYGLRGIIWYQGENNVERAEQYRTLLPALIRDWRLAWGQGDIPFGIVQLAGYRAHPTKPGPSTWAELRDAQAHAAQTGKRIGLVTALDLGDVHDIHPRDKRTVAERLAAWALSTIHAQPTPWEGPQLDHVAIDGGVVKVRLRANGLVTRDGKPPRGFAIAGRDRTFVWADARIEGTNEIVLSSAQVPTPLAVRYAWADHPEVNLVDRDGLPAMPFRSDDWPLTTAGKR